MEKFARSLVQIQIEEEMRSSYLDYSMSVIIGRALPDVRDGLKPVHRRILFAMLRNSLHWNRAYRKCANVVGEVLGKLHPHGDASVYDALVRMAQPWNMRELLIDGQGNFGSVDGDPPAAYRYTECRMTRLADELLGDIEEETVDFIANYDGKDEEPVVLPAAFPNMLVNGSEGIAVGMATKIPPHNLAEAINACLALIDDPTIDCAGLMKHIPAPDFPTAGVICGTDGIKEAYETGRGRVVIRGTTEFEDIDGREAIIITELPFQVNKARLQESIADLVKDKRLEGIYAVRDESDRDGMRVVIELKRDAVREIVLNHLYKHTELQTSFGIIMLAIIQQRPRVLTLKEMLQYFLAHRREVVVRRTRYRLRKAQERAHILEGYRIALDHLDEVIQTIRSSRTVDDARSGLRTKFDLSEIQAQAILDLRLQRLTGMEREAIEAEYAEVMAEIRRLTEILENDNELWGVIKTELIAVRDRFGNPRRTRITEDRTGLSVQDLIAEEEQIITLSHLGYIKRTPTTEYRMQRRGGVGKTAMATRDADFVQDIFIGNTHGYLLAFTNKGHMYWIRVYDIPEAAPSARGRPLVNLIQLEADEKIASVVSVKDFKAELDLVFISRGGLIKRTELEHYGNVRAAGIMAVDVVEGDELLRVVLASRENELLITTKSGMSIRFPGEDVRPMGRVARGVRGVDLADDDLVVDITALPPDAQGMLLSVTEKGYGKRTELGEYRLQGRGGKGVIDIQTEERNGLVAGSLIVHQGDQVLLITDSGRVIRTQSDEIRQTGRNTKGVRIMRLDDSEKIVALCRVEDDSEETGETIAPEAVDEGAAEGAAADTVEPTEE